MTIKVPGDSLPKRLAAVPMDIIGAFVNRGELLPPFSMRRFVGEGRWQLRGENFKLEGNRLVEKLIRDAELGPDSKILDLGSGCGRLAIPLTHVLDRRGAYRGLEPVKALSGWCSGNITPRFPNFQFKVADVRNALYNPKGAFLAEELAFPFSASQFDLIVATSVFTHLRSKAIEQYASECARVLKPQGRVFASFFLLDNGVRSPDGKMNFSYSVAGDADASSLDKNLPERAVAYKSDRVVALFERKGLKLSPPIRWGNWAGYQPGYSWQDIVIFQKQAA